MNQEVELQNKVVISQGRSEHKAKTRDEKNYQEVNDKSYISVMKVKEDNEEKFIELDMKDEIKEKEEKIISENLVEEKNSKLMIISSTVIKYEVLLQNLTSKDPLDYLEVAKSAVVSQIVDKKVFLSGCEPPVRYTVEIISYMGEFKRIFTCRETHRWCQKNCCL